DDVPVRLEGHETSRPFAVLTFDDGYRDNIEYAWPILTRHDVPWTVFITPDFVDRCGRPWWLELEEAIARLDYFEITLSKTKLAFDTRRPRGKNAAYHYLFQRLKAGPDQELLAVTTRLASLIDVDLRQYVGGQFASWDEISELARDPNVTIGS